MNGLVHRDYAGAKLGMWLFLFTEVILFGGLFLLYAVYLSRYPHGFTVAGHELNLVYGTLNTVILLTSSLLVAMALTALQRDLAVTSVRLLAGAVLCAVVFLGIKYLEWGAKIAHGIYPGSGRLASAMPGESVFFSLYYLTTGLHGLHVLIGAVLLGTVAARVRRGTVNGADSIWLENSALYWHLVDLIWIFVFPLYYLLL